MQYIRYTIRNTGPLRITDDSTSQQGQMETLRYIPGSTIRGYVIGRFAADGILPQFKRALLSDSCRFMNAYSSLSAGEDRQLLIPPLKGFYEDKKGDEPKALHNVLKDPALPETLKRSSLGDGVLLCKKAEDAGMTMRTYSLKKGSDLRIRVNADGSGNDTALFRNDYILPGHEFTGFIAVESPDLADEIIKRFEEEFRIGNARSSGYGRCRLIEGPVRTTAFPYSHLAESKSRSGCCYMVLLSDAVMRSGNGEYCGLNEEKLGDLLGVERLKIDECATSLADVRGYNMTWGAFVPSVSMYEKGSVFRLRFSGDAKAEKMNELMEKGIGVRRNEGFGQVLFIRDYEDILFRESGTEPLAKVELSHLDKEDRAVLKRIARSYYCRMIEDAMIARIASASSKGASLQLKGVSKSQLGTLEALATSFRYDPEKGIKEIRRLFSHSIEKSGKTKRQADGKSLANVSSVFLTDILDADLDNILNLENRWKEDTIMGIPRAQLLEEKEKNRYKLELISKLIRFEYREG